MTTNEGKGRSRKERPIRRLTDGMKKAIVYLVCVSLIGTSMLSSSVFADEDDSISDSGDMIVYLDNDGSVETGSNAARSGGSGGGSSVITADEVESAANAKKASVVYEGYSDGITVSVEVPEGALPEGTDLVVERYATGSDEFVDAAEAIGREADDENMAAVDIHFELDGEEVEPSEEVTVSIDVSDILPEEADPASIVVTHLEEIESEEDDAEEDEESEIAELSLVETKKEVKPVVVANKKKGEIDKENAVATFTVKNFSVFTVEWNDGTTDTIEVHVYNVNGTSINETLDEPSEQIASSGTIEISELVAHLQSNSTLASEYTYQYATVIYETDLGGPGYSSDTLGGSDNSVVSISRSGTTYTVTFVTGSDTVSDPALIKINLYYSTPTITLSTEDPYGATVSFTVSSEYYQHEDEGSTSYAWALSNDSAGTLTPGTGENVGTATFAWDTDTAQAGDQVTITVTKTVTYGDEQKETASDTYTLTYGEDPVTFTVTLNGTPQANAHVAIVDESGNTISTGITDESGQVTLYTVDGGTYTVGVTYCIADTSGMGGGSTSRYTAEGTVTLSDDGTVATGDTTLALGTAIVSGPGNNTSGIVGGGIDGVYYYEHIDVKVAAAGTEDTQVNFSDLDAVYVYDKYGNLIYVSEDLERNPETGDYNCLFDINGSEDQHSIVVSSEDTIVIVYEVVDSEGNYSTYTASYNGGGAYPSGEYYPYSAVNAYQLYNYINNTTYSEDQFLEMVENGTLTGNGIDIGSMGYTEVADCLCDTRTTTGQAGLDFVIYVTEIEDIFGQYDFRVAKTLQDAPSTVTAETIEDFTFELQDVSSVVDGTTYTEGVWTTTGNPTAGSTSASSWTQGSDGNWNAIVDFTNALTYTAEDGTYFYYFVLSEQDPTTATPEQQYYGIKVTVTYSSSTGVAEIVASYCNLTKVDDSTYNRASTWMELSEQPGYDEESGEDYTYFEIPFVNTYSTTGFELKKVDESGNALSGAVFTITFGETELYFIPRTDDEGNIVYTLSEEGVDGATTDITVTDGGPISIQGIGAGTYTLTEIEAPVDYKKLTDDISITIAVNDEGSTTVTVTGGDSEATASEGLVTVKNELIIPGLSKEVDEDDYERKEESGEGMHDGEDTSGKGWGSWDDADNNQEITYQLTITDIAGATNLTVHDYLQEGLDFEKFDSTEDVDVELYDYDENGTLTQVQLEELSEGHNEEKGFEFSDSACSDPQGCQMEDCTFEVKIHDSVFEDISDEAYIVITYKAITDTQWSDYEDYEDDITNYAYMSYGVSSYRTQVISAETDLFGFGIYKYAVGDDGNVSLAGAEFILEREGQYATFDPETDEETGDVYYIVSGWGESADTLTSGEDGMIRIEGLDDDTYTLTETKAPAGHDLLGPITVAIDEYGRVTFTDSNGNSSTVADHIVNVEDPVSLFDITVIKYWNDDDNRDGLETDIQVQLKADGENLGDVVTLNDDDKWTYTWEDLPAAANGVEITYTVEEVSVLEGYEAADYPQDPDEDGNVTIYMVNTHEDALTNIQVIKSWDDNDNASGDRPDSVTVQLMANGEASGDSVVLNDGNEWSHTWSDLYSYENGEYIEYTVKETAVDNYKTTIGNLVPIADDDNNLLYYEITVTNTLPSDEPEPDFVTVSGSKTWTDNDDEDGLRPDSITINLLANGEIVQTITVTEAEGWSWNWEDLDRYDSEGNEIVYSITEEKVDGYTTVYTNGYDVENVRGPVKSVSVGGSSVSRSQNLEYTISAINETDEPATITIVDELPSSLTFVSSSNEYQYVQDGQKITFTFEDVAPGEEVSATFTARVVYSSGEVANSATVDIGGNSYTTNTVTNTIRTSGGSGGGSSSSGGSGRASGNTGPGSTGTVTEGEPSESSSTSINTDDIGALPYTGESNTAAILMGLCALFVVLLGGLFYMRSKTPREDE